MNILSAIIAAAFAFLPTTTVVALDINEPQQIASLAYVPDGLTKSDWQSIHAAYEAGRHSFQPIESGWQAINPGQQWTTSFDKRGFTAKPQDGEWTWGLQLLSYGFGENQTLISGRPVVQAVGQRLNYQWDAKVQEWFVNDPRGLEHGFTVAERPVANQESELSFTMVTRGDLTPHVSEQGVAFQNTAGVNVLNYKGLKVWDADGTILASRFEPAEGKSFRLVVDERSARYPITIDPIAQQAYIKASNTARSKYFGKSVAVSGDTVVIGSFYEDSNATGVNGNQLNTGANASGAAYVFTRSAGVWSQQAYLKASNTEAYDTFGISVAISGDTVIVGANEEDSNATGVNGNQTNNSATQAGAAYVFTRTAGVWSQQAYLKASNTGEYDHFGISVAVSGDTAVVGAYRESSNATSVNGNEANNSASQAGAAYVFTRSAGVWSQQAYLKASNAETDDWFGMSVAASGDTVLVGAFQEDSSTSGLGGNQANNSASQAGAAYVFTRSAGIWSQQAYLKASNTEAFDYFGYSVSVSGDTAIVGAFNEASNATGVNGNQANNSASGAGAAYVFIRSSGLWSQQAYLKASNAEAGDNFGFSVSVSGDTAIVGAGGNYGESSNATGVDGNQADNSAIGSGAAYVFTRGANVWSQHAYLKASNTNSYDNFGKSVAVSGDTVIVGAVGESSNATGVNGNQVNESSSYSGAAYTFLITTSVPLVTTPTSVVTSAYTATLGGNVSNDGASAITERGVVYSRTSVNNNPLISGSGVTKITATGTTGVFTVLVTGLTSGSSYSLKAYAINNIGITYTSVATFATPFPSPEIAVEQPAATNLTSGAASISFGARPVGIPSASKTFIIRNIGTINLNLSAPAVIGGNASDFAVNNSGILNAISVAGQTSFTVVFTPSGGGLRYTTLTIDSDDADEPQFMIALTGTGLLLANDTDSDGLNDVAEFNYANLGFDWQVSQPTLVATLLNGANSANLYTPTQVQTLNINTPLLSRNVSTGIFTLTIGIQKSATLENGSFLNFPFNPLGTTVNGEGKVEFQFTSPENAAFFRLQAQ